jgi:hypothetical protein
MQKQTYVQYAIEQHVTREREPYKSGDSKPLLWASDMNKCQRNAMLRVTSLAEPTIQPDTKMQLYFQAGNMWEDDTLASLRWYYGDDLTDQLVLKNDTWSGKCDFALYHDDADKQTVLIEHKAKGDKWWNYNDQLPQSDHVGQLYIYWHLYKKLYGSEPKLVLFYRTWGHYAEFYIEPQLGYIDIHGEIDGQAVVKRYTTDLAGVRQEMERYYTNGELPPRLLDKEEGCTFRGKPSCPFYDYCWGSSKTDAL